MHSRLGNEVAQTMQTLVGGHMTKQTGLWLEHLHLVKGLVKQGGGKVTATGLTRSDLLQTEPVEWANQVLLPAIEKTGALSEKNVRARMNLLRADALKAGQTPDDRVLRERAEQGLISAELSKSGMRTTVTDQLAHAIANELLINRDVAAVKKADIQQQRGSRSHRAEPDRCAQRIDGIDLKFHGRRGRPGDAGGRARLGRASACS